MVFILDTFILFVFWTTRIGALTWRFQTPLNPKDDAIKLFELFIKEVENATNNELKIQMLTGGASGISCRST